MAWPRNSIWFFCFLVIGFLGTLPFVFGLAGKFWWVAIPAVAAWTVVLWVWGLPFIASPETVKASSTFEKIIAVLMMLGQSLVGVGLAVFLIRFLIDQWIALVLGLILVAVLSFVFGRDPKKKPHDHSHAHLADAHPADSLAAVAQPAPAVAVAAPAALATPAPAPPVVVGPVTAQDWMMHHISVLLFVPLCVGAIVINIVHQPAQLLWPLQWGALAAYFAVIWNHVVTDDPGKPSNLFQRALLTLIAVVMTFVVIVMLISFAEVIGKFWIWIVPPVGLFAVFCVFEWNNPKPKTVLEAKHAKAVKRAATHEPRIVH